MKTNLLYLSMAVILFACNKDAPQPLVKKYEVEWEMDVASKFDKSKSFTPGFRPIQLVQSVVLEDASLFMIFAKKVSQNQFGDFFVAKLSSDGVKLTDVAKRF